MQAAAAAWAIIAGCVLNVGHFTPVTVDNLSVTWDMSLIVLQTNGIYPVCEIHG
ncbi:MULTISPECIES: hypothetical protein [Methanobacterium]|uniref:hypothetical protein n=1 Tax=Methanobacterium TaxID=2160 RepID=UPI00159F2D61|nr:MULTISPECIES: hypothetical protein [Methanobacterium]